MFDLLRLLRCLFIAGSLAAGGCSVIRGEKSLTDVIQPQSISDHTGRALRKATGREINPNVAKQLYASAEELHRRGLDSQGEEREEALVEAAELFVKAADRWPSSVLEEDALYMAGESYYFTDYYPKASALYQTLLKKYPQTRYLDTVGVRSYRIAVYWLEWHEEDPRSFWSWNFSDPRRPRRSDFTDAVKTFDRIRLDDPTGELADDATLAAGNAYFASNKYENADRFYSDLRKTFPSSKHQFTAHMLGLKAKMLTYQGHEYSGHMLDEAEELVKKINKQFPRDSQQRKDELNKAYYDILRLKAEREWEKARYYDRRKEYGAARFHYHMLESKYPQTPYADEARQRLAELQGEPDMPESRLQWLSDLFPAHTDKESKPIFGGDGFRLPWQR